MGVSLAFTLTGWLDLQLIKQTVLYLYCALMDAMPAILKQEYLEPNKRVYVVIKFFAWHLSDLALNHIVATQFT